MIGFIISFGEFIRGLGEWVCLVPGDGLRVSLAACLLLALATLPSPGDDESSADEASKLQDLDELVRRLESHEAHLKAALIGSQTGTWRYEESQDEITFCSQGAELLGLTAGLTYCASDLVQDIVEADQPSAMDAFRGSLASGVPFQVVYRIVHPETGIRWIKSSGQSVQTPTGQVMYGVIFDVTAEQQANQLLEEKQHQLVATKRLAGIGTCWLDLLTRQIEFSSIATEVLGERFNGQMPFEEFIQHFRPKCQARWEQVLTELHDGAGQFSLDLEVGRDDANLEGVWQMTVLNHGFESRVHAVMQDVTTLRLAGLKVAQSEARFRAAIESMVDGVLIVAETGQVLTSNESARRMLGVTEAEISAVESAIEFLSFMDTDGNQFEPAAHPLTRAFCTGFEEHGRLLMYQGTRVGGPLHLTVNFTPILIEGSQYASAVVVILRDSSDELRWRQGQAEMVMALSASEREQKRLARDLQLANDRLTHLAQRDGLTGMYNHRSWQERLHEEVLSAGFDRPLTVALLDVDHFKQFNDTFGHQVGDEVLKQVGEVLQSLFPEPDFTARYGGEEFGILLPGADANAAELRLEAARLAIAEISGLPRQVTASFGAVTTRDASKTPAQLLALSDEALYQSKRKGRNRVTFLIPPEICSAAA